MHFLRFVSLFLFSLLLLVDVEAFAAQQKKPKPAAQPKPSYEAPMRVVVVRNSFPTCEPDCPQWISADGEITAATPAAFRKIFKQIGAKNLPLVIRSPGGSINHAIEIGNMVRKRKMTVAVGFTLYRGCRPDEATCKLPKEAKGIFTGSITEFGAFCNSACPMILAAGTTRLASVVASVGLHQPKTEWSQEMVRWRDTYRIINGKKKILKRTIVSKKIVKGKTTYGLDKSLRKKMGNYYKSMGVDVAILEEMQRAKYQDMYWLPAHDRDRLRLRTSVGSAGALGNVIGTKLAVKGIEECKVNGSTYVGEICKTLKANISLTQTATAKTLGPPMTVRLALLAEPACASKCPSWIVLEGRISPNTPELLDAFVKKFRLKHEVVVLNSTGGDVEAAIQLGRNIRSLGFDTLIGKTVPARSNNDKSEMFAARLPGVGFCRGSCLMAFIGGKQRHIDNKAKYQIQDPFADFGTTGENVLLMKMERHLNYLDVRSDFILNRENQPVIAKDGVAAVKLIQERIATDAFDNAVVFDWKGGQTADQN